MAKNASSPLKAKNRVMFWTLLGLCILFYILSIVKMKGF